MSSQPQTSSLTTETTTASTVHRRSVLAWGLGAGVGLFAAPALAHRSHTAMTSVAWIPNDAAAPDASGRLEVEHRFYGHDLIAALARQPEGAPDSFEPLRARARAALYVADRFSLMDANGAPIALTTLGAQVVSDRVLVFQEALGVARPTALGARSSVLMEVHADQINRVNLHVAGKVRTLSFTGGEPAQTARFD